MTYRYVYYKTDWYGDLDTEFYVDISGKSYLLIVTQTR